MFLGSSPVAVELELITDVGMLFMTEKGIRGEICHVIHKYVNINNKYMKNYDKNEESSFLEYLDANNLTIYMVGQCLNHYQLMVLNG